MGHVFLLVLRYSSVSIIPPVLHTRHHLRSVVNKDKWAKSENLPKISFVSGIAEYCVEINVHLFLKSNEHDLANQDLFKSKLLTKKSKLRMYQTLVRPVVTYGCETWVLKENIKTKLRVFEKKALRRIYGPTKESDGTWRI